MKKIETELKKFTRENKIIGKGPLCVVLVITRQAKELGMPINPDSLLTQGRGQVVGLGKSAVQSILKDHGIDRTLAEEGGRTSRGSVRKMRLYVDFLNQLHHKGLLDLNFIESWWIKKVKEYFAGKPFILRLDSSQSLRSIIEDLLNQAEKRQSEVQGSTLVGTMLQHLVGAKLNLLLDSPPKHHGANVADSISEREGDFIIEDVVIHVTTFPSESLIRKCDNNLDKNLKPVIITTKKKISLAEGLAEQLDISNRVDIFEAEQFLAGNLYELGQFAQKGRQTTTENLISEYNSIVEECETDPSLRINLG